MKYIHYEAKINNRGIKYGHELSWFSGAMKGKRRQIKKIASMRGTYAVKTR